jgi:2-phosphosulfolactate phosphatase
MDKRVWIGSGPPCARRFGPEDAVVVVDVIRATTTAVTAAALGGRCLPVPSVERAWALARRLPRPLLMGELDGARPDGFDLTNSPAALARRHDLRERPIVLLSSSGTPLLDAVAGAGAVYPACLRNRRAVARHVAAHHTEVAVLGAASRGQFRAEDQLCCAFIAGSLVRAGFVAADDETAACIARWCDAPLEAFSSSRSVRYLRQTGQLDDLEFILRHVDDLDAVFRLHQGALVRADDAPARAAAV